MRRFVLPLFVFASASPSIAADAVRGQDSYEKQVLPLLEQYCYDCHSDGVKKGKFSMDEHQDYAGLRADMKHWDHVRQMLNTHVMPPLNKKGPTLEQRDQLVKWIDENIFYFDPAKPDPGHVVMRRLNRTEYNNTIREVFFLDSLKPANDFPPDDTGYGYDNIGAVLSLSPMLMEKYLRAARKVADAALKVEAPEKASIEVGAAKFDKNVKDTAFEDDGVLWFFGNAENRATFQVPADGTYRVVLHMAASQAGPDKARVAIKIDGKKQGDYDIAAQWKEQKTDWQQIIIETPINKGYRKVSVTFLNDYFDEKAPEHHRDRNVALDKVTIEGPIGLTKPRPSRFLAWLAPQISYGLPALSLSGEDFLKGDGPSERDTGAMLLASAGYVHHPLEIKEAGKYRLTLKAGAMQAGTEGAKWEVRLVDQVIQAGSVTANNQAPQWFKFETDLPVGRQDLRVAFLNDFYDEATKADRNFWLHELKIEGPVANQDTLDSNDLPWMIEKLGSRVFRRPLAETEKTKWIKLVQTAVKEGESAMGALGYAIEGMVASPAFLFHNQPTPIGSRLGDTELIDEATLAERLSYFLWSAPPDDRLRDLADKGELRKNLGEEVRRLIGDYRGWAMTENFAGQWLLLRDTDLVSPDRRRFPDFGGISTDMKLETQHFFDHILRGNRSVIEFLNADYTFLNRNLARFYDLKDTEKQIKSSDRYKFEKVSLKGTPRAGILTQGSILTVTSNPTRTNIVRRGKFVLENILGMTPPPAPGDIPPLDEKAMRKAHLTLRQQFEKHREDMSCAGCHALLDPIGFALENYDAIGRWRIQEESKPIDSTGKLIRGQQFSNLQDLRDIIVRDMKPDFVRCLCENLLTYSLGRGLKYSDRPTIQELVRRAEASDYRFQDVIIAVCESVPFQRMRME